MLETAYVITWRYDDGSASGATAAFTDKPRAEVLLGLLQIDTHRVYKLEPVPFGSAPGAPGAKACALGYDTLCSSCKPDAKCREHAAGGVTGRCPKCDDTGEVHRADGEWLGTCHCPAGLNGLPLTEGDQRLLALFGPEHPAMADLIALLIAARSPCGA